ncbi:replication initiation protein [Polynucleobacter sp. Fuers-14]|uniref:replication initiation protein n=1 Tax=Polynucleobacter sp. Fuers-14 TaxID=1758364 RepID=UPI001C0CF00E|nr:replication initiation protein [Polynucleobacter sp. Fuers-14]MBU3640966.1 replication initiation protein [Polynucleobacter sp. Fuers-14]
MTRFSALADAYQSGNERFLEQGGALNRVLVEAPFYPRVSDNKTATLTRPRHLAVRFPYMQINRRDMVSWLIFDLDHANPSIWEDSGLPAPNLIVQNRKSRGAHLYYAIKPVCTSLEARTKPIDYMKSIYSAMATKLKADIDFHSGPVAKTPGHPWWATTELHNHEYELGQLADYVDLPLLSPWAKNPNIDLVSHSRHCIMFEWLRHYAYSIVKHEQAQGTFEGFTRMLEAFAHNKNSFYGLGFCQNLSQSSLKATVKSVARWTWERYTGSGRCHRGVMRLDPALPLEERKRLSALRTHEQRRKATEAKIRATVRHLQREGVAVTQAAISRFSKLARQTIANYAAVITEALKPTSISFLKPLKEILLRPKTVKYGVHQVTGFSQKRQTAEHGVEGCFKHVPDVPPKFQAPLPDD